MDTRLSSLSLWTVCQKSFVITSISTEAKFTCPAIWRGRNNFNFFIISSENRKRNLPGPPQVHTHSFSTADGLPSYRIVSYRVRVRSAEFCPSASPSVDLCPLTAFSVNSVIIAWMFLSGIRSLSLCPPLCLCSIPFSGSALGLDRNVSKPPLLSAGVSSFWACLFVCVCVLMRVCVCVCVWLWVGYRYIGTGTAACCVVELMSS